MRRTPGCGIHRRSRSTAPWPPFARFSRKGKHAGGRTGVPAFGNEVAASHLWLATPDLLTEDVGSEEAKFKKLPKIKDATERRMPP